jgi:hypothetical protein
MTEEKDRVLEEKKERQKEIEKENLESSVAETEDTGCLSRAPEARKERQKEIDRFEPDS